MKQQLWILNSSLLLLFVVAFFINYLLQQPTPRFRVRRPRVTERKVDTKTSVQNIESIYKYDLFGTYIPQRFAPAAQNFVTPIPQPQAVTPPKPPEIAKPTFLDPLKITLKGIAFSSDEEKSISMVLDENNKEKIYHVGDSVKDAQLIRIGKTRITLLRANGQHETLFLRKDDPKSKKAGEINFENLVKKTEENTYEVDFREFTQVVPNLGRLSEMLSLLTIYKDGKPTGLKITNLTPEAINKEFGLAKDDLILSVNGIKTAESQDRVAIYDKLREIKKGDTITLVVSRGGSNSPTGGEEVTLTYKLTELEKVRKIEFAPQAEAEDKTEGETEKPAVKEKKKEDVKTRLAKLRERQRQRRAFARRHPNRQSQALAAIRQRLLENIRNRVRNARIR